MNDEQKKFFLDHLVPSSFTQRNLSGLEAAEVLVRNGRADQINKDVIFAYSYSLMGVWPSGRSVEPARTLMVYSYQRIRSRDVMYRVRTIYLNPRKALPIRFLASVVLLKSGVYQRTYDGVLAYDFLLQNLENKEIPNEYRARAKEVIEEVGPEVISEMDRRLERFFKSKDGQDYLRECERRVR
jgi:hypothetical protein